MSESPLAFNTWAAISTVSAVLKNKVYYQDGDDKLFPNQFIILVGPPGVGKGRSIKPAHRFAKNPPSPMPPLANYITDKVTYPKLVEMLATGFATTPHLNSNGHFVSPMEYNCILQAAELSSLIMTNDGITGFLCDAWDRGDYMYNTKNKGSSTIQDMCVSLVGACVPEFVKVINKARGDVVSNGFTARCIFVYGMDRSKILPYKPAMSKVCSDALSNDLLTIAQLNGQFTMDASASAIYEQKYRMIKAEEGDSEVVKHFKSRQTTHILKVAMAMSAATNDSLVIDAYAMSASIVLVEGILTTLDQCFAGIGDSTLAEPISRIQTYMKRVKRASKIQITKDNWRHVHPQDLDTVLNLLCGCKILLEYDNGGYKHYEYL